MDGFRCCRLDRQSWVDSHEIMGVSTQAPIYAELEGRRAGDEISFGETEFVFKEIA